MALRLMRPTPHLLKKVALTVGYWAFEQLKITHPSVQPNRKVPGLTLLPKGYELAILPDNATIVANTDAETENFKISSSYNFAQVVVSIVQLVASSITLYRTRGDQLIQYGYAAFGLTVLPYVTMSIVNFVGNLATPNYQAMYLVHSPELEEAKERGGSFDGTIGKLLEAEPPAEEAAYNQVANFNADGTTDFNKNFTVRISNSNPTSNENSEIPKKKLLPLSRIPGSLTLY